MFLWPAPILGVSFLFAASGHSLSAECASGSVDLALKRAYGIPALKELMSRRRET